MLPATGVVTRALRGHALDSVTGDGGVWRDRIYHRSGVRNLRGQANFVFAREIFMQTRWVCGVRTTACVRAVRFLRSMRAVRRGRVVCSGCHRKAQPALIR